MSFPAPRLLCTVDAVQRSPPALRLGDREEHLAKALLGEGGIQGETRSPVRLKDMVGEVESRSTEVSSLSESGRHSPSRLFPCLRGLRPLPVPEVNSGTFTPGFGAPTPKRLRG